MSPLQHLKKEFPMKNIDFTKAVGSGNDFVIIDNRKKICHGNLSRLAREICDRKNSIGADGMLLLEDSKKGDFKMRIFNPDGSEVDMCGNGARCIAEFAYKKRIAGKKMKIDTRAGILEAEVMDNSVRLKMSNPGQIRLRFNLDIGGMEYEVNYINTGVPHVVRFEEDVDRVDVRKFGAIIRYHKEFSPSGTNANFVEVASGHKIRVRTYERGVEDETLACGTGATASAIIASMLKGVKPPVEVITKGQEVLRIYFKIDKVEVKDVYLEGGARLVYEGRKL